MAPNPEFGISCPEGGDFYACHEDKPEWFKFVGCCLFDPCAPNMEGLCDQLHNRRMSFNADAYSLIPPQRCRNFAAAEWYTCLNHSPPFMGCCRADACTASGCTAADLDVAVLSPNDTEAAPFWRYTYTTVTKTVTLTGAGNQGTPTQTLTTVLLTSIGDHTVTSVITRPHTQTATVVAGNPTTTPLPPETPPPKDKHLDLALGVGITTFAVLGAIIVYFCVTQARFRRRRREHERKNHLTELRGRIGSPVPVTSDRYSDIYSVSDRLSRDLGYADPGPAPPPPPPGNGVDATQGPVGAHGIAPWSQFRRELKLQLQRGGERPVVKVKKTEM
ncbi:hypothetical protein F4778DRAFT_777104 [Xylariomycetidae sp. FL2044]|nr:hypothetical protein F4778DRAFT_777104 [Xylariomycetidae sp. FL2044]